MVTKEQINAVIDNRLKSNTFRNELYEAIPEGTSEILEFGVNDGHILYRLRRDKRCKGLYGVDIKPLAVTQGLDGVWDIDLGREDAELGAEYKGRFSHIISANTLEHVEDPWYVLGKLRSYLADGGKALFEVPNLQYWISVYRLLMGEFPYSSGGRYDYTHLRWYTVQSFAEVVSMAGYTIEGVRLIMGDGERVLRAIQDLKELKTIELPPPGLSPGTPRVVLRYPVDVKAMYPFLLAFRFILICRKGDAPVTYEPTRPDSSLEAHRAQWPNPLQVIPKLLPDILEPAVRRSLVEQGVIKG